MREDQVRRMVRRVVLRTLGMLGGAKGRSQKPLIAEADLQAVDEGGTLDVPAGALVTPLARQVAIERNVRLRGEGSNNPDSTSGGKKIVAIGADHGGFELKVSLVRSLKEWGNEVIDCGTQSSDAVDYPDFALAVAQMVASGQAWRGVMIDGAGIGSCMAANKVPGVRASMCYDQATAVNSREHNKANLLTLGAGLISTGQARSMLKTWLETPFAGGRHTRRVDKIGEIERRYLRSRVAA